MKIVAYLFLFIGTPFIPVGFSYLLWERKVNILNKRQISPEVKAENTSNKIQLIISLIIAFLTFATAIVQLVSQIKR